MCETHHYTGSQCKMNFMLSFHSKSFESHHSGPRLLCFQPELHQLPSWPQSSQQDSLKFPEPHGLYFFNFFWGGAPVAYGGSKARGLIRAAAATLCHSHSSGGSRSRLRPLPQLTAMPDPYPTEQGQGSNPKPHGY